MPTSGPLCYIKTHGTPPQRKQLSQHSGGGDVFVLKVQGPARHVASPNGLDLPGVSVEMEKLQKHGFFNQGIDLLNYIQ